MTRLDALDAALLALGAFLDAHGHEAACGCGPCRAYQQATALLPRLGHLLTSLEAWSQLTPEEPILAQDLRLLLTLLDGQEERG